MLSALQGTCWLSGLQSVVYILDEIIQAQCSEVNMLQRLGLRFSRKLHDKKGRAKLEYRC